MSITQRILLVDDNEADNVYHEIILRRSGFTGEVLIKESAQSALDCLRQCTEGWPELIFVDVNMPGMDGFAFVRHAANMMIAQQQSSVVMLLTSSDAAQDRHKAGELSTVSGYIIKPLTLQAVTKLLSSANEPTL